MEAVAFLYPTTGLGSVFCTGRRLLVVFLQYVGRADSPKMWRRVGYFLQTPPKCSTVTGASVLWFVYVS